MCLGFFVSLVLIGAIKPILKPPKQRDVVVTLLFGTEKWGMRMQKLKCFSLHHFKFRKYILEFHLICSRAVSFCGDNYQYTLLIP